MTQATVLANRLSATSPPQAGQRSGKEAVSERDCFLTVVKHESQFEVVARGACQFPKPFEVACVHGGTRFDLNAHQSACVVFDDNIYLVLIFIPIVTERVSTAHPGNLFQDLREDECFEKRSEDGAILSDPLCCSSHKRGGQARVEEVEFRCFDQAL